MAQRKDYIVSTSYRTYLTATILTMVIEQLCLIFDGIIMSHLMGPDAMSAINLMGPFGMIVGVHLAPGIAIDEDGVAGLEAGDREQFAFAPLFELGCLGSIGLVESHLASAFVAYRQFATLGLVRPVPGTVIHQGNQLAILGGVGKRLVLDGHGLFARQEENIAHARAAQPASAGRSGRKQ